MKSKSEVKVWGQKLLNQQLQFQFSDVTKTPITQERFIAQEKYLHIWKDNWLAHLSFKGIHSIIFTHWAIAGRQSSHFVSIHIVHIHICPNSTPVSKPWPWSMCATSHFCLVVLLPHHLTLHPPQAWLMPHTFRVQNTRSTPPDVDTFTYLPG